MKIIAVIVATICNVSTSSAFVMDTVKLLFVYGSKPKGPDEARWFGGMHGGHVSISYKDGYMSFIPTEVVHIFSKKHINSTFTIEKEDAFVFDTTGSRYSIFSIPINKKQKHMLDSILEARYKQATYDYAFFGFRCASSTYEIMSLAGILPVKSRKRMIYDYFYPKLLRREIMVLAKKNCWLVAYREGRETRKWEEDD